MNSGDTIGKGMISGEAAGIVRITGDAAGKGRMMKKPETNTTDSNTKNSENRNQPGDFEAFYEMINRCCEGQRGEPDCCSGMKKLWEERKGKSQEDRKQK